MKGEWESEQPTHNGFSFELVNIFETFFKCLPPHENGCHVVETQCFAPTLRMVVKTIKRNHQPKI
jgi:hypothetical protein